MIGGGGDYKEMVSELGNFLRQNGVGSGQFCTTKCCGSSGNKMVSERPVYNKMSERGSRLLQTSYSVINWIKHCYKSIEAVFYNSSLMEKLHLI